jgi:uncharacterized repeat protein (TIGR04076 family)
VKKLDAVQLTIKKCGDCPHHKVGSSYSLDGWDRGSDWTCTKAGKVIVPFVEWKREEPKGVPDWCPLRTLERKTKAGKR